MEAIKVYVEQMFLSLPNTTELIKLKEEILQNMEDKYNELKSDGKNENEAIGTVISEFGNIDEILDEFNLKKGADFNEINSTSDKPTTRIMNDEEVDDYLATNKVTCQLISTGTILCIVGAALLIFISGFFGSSAKDGASNFDFLHFSIGNAYAGILGVIILLLFVCVAVTLFIISGAKSEKYNYVEKETIILSDASKNKIESLLSKRKDIFLIKTCIGVVVCILAVIQLLLVIVLSKGNDIATISSVSALLVMIAIAVYFFITGSSEQETYERILQKGDFAVINRNPVLETVSTIYWCLATAIYLGISFATGGWTVSWVIWPVAGVAWAAIAAIIELITNHNKQIND